MHVVVGVQSDPEKKKKQAKREFKRENRSARVGVEGRAASDLGFDYVQHLLLVLQHGPGGVGRQPYTSGDNTVQQQMQPPHPVYSIGIGTCALCGSNEHIMIPEVFLLAEVRVKHGRHESVLPLEPVSLFRPLCQPAGIEPLR